MTSVPDKTPSGPAPGRKSEVRRAFAIAALLVSILALGYFFFLRKRVTVWLLDRHVAESTTALPACDRVEVFRLAASKAEAPADPAPKPPTFPIPPNHKSAAILQSTTLTGAEAAAFVDLWRQQKFGQEFLTLRHRPEFAFRAYSGEQVIFETSLSFDDNTFYTTIYGTVGWWGFDTKSPAAAQLLNVFRSKFPSPPPTNATSNP